MKDEIPEPPKVDINKPVFLNTETGYIENVNLDLNAEEESKALDTLQKEEDMSLHVHCNNCGVNALPDVRKEVYEGSNIMPGGHTELYDACVRCGSEDIITLEDFNDKAI